MGEPIGKREIFRKYPDPNLILFYQCFNKSSKR